MQVHDDEADHEGRSRDDLEIQEGTQADSADVPHRPHLRDAHHHGCEHHRRNEHSNELDEPIAKRSHGLTVLRRHQAENDTCGDADEDLHVET